MRPRGQARRGDRDQRSPWRQFLTTHHRRPASIRTAIAIPMIQKAVMPPRAPGWPRYMLRRYCPPTSNSALVIWPSEHTRTASISTANTLPLAITVSFRR